MTKSKKIISALLSAVICTGVVCAITANAQLAENAKPSSEENQETIGIKLPSTDELDISVDEDEPRELTTKELVHNLMFGSDSVFEEYADGLAAIGVPTYQATEPIPVSEIESAASVFYPTNRITLPYNISLGEISKGTVVASKYYFTPADDDITMGFNLWAYGNNGKILTLKATLYKEPANMAGSNNWQKVSDFKIDFSDKVGVEQYAFNLSSSYVYCLTFENASDSIGTISGNVTVTD